MALDIGITNFQSLNREDGVRPYDSKPDGDIPVDVLMRQLEATQSVAIDRIMRSFNVPDSCVGLLGFLEETRRDFQMIEKIVGGFVIPEWANSFGKLAPVVSEAIKTDASRDLSALRGQPKNSLRDYLSLVDKTVTVESARALRAIRGLITLETLSSKSQISGTLADEIKRWMAGKFPAEITPAAFQVQSLWEIEKKQKLDSDTAKLINHVITALKAELKNPFDSLPRQSPVVTTVAPDEKNACEQAGDDSEESNESDESSTTRDPLKNFLSETSNASTRKFCGVPTYQCLLPFELEAIIPRIEEERSGEFSDESLASLVTLFTRVMPSAFSKIPISRIEDAGLWLNVQAGLVCWNLDEAIGSNTADGPYRRSLKDRFVAVPLPVEVACDLARRASMNSGAITLDQLFNHSPHALSRSTKAFLRSISLSSHRPTLTRLSKTWARYLLNFCRDEAYASAIGIDFTIGTSANFNYVMLRGEKLCSIVRQGYRQIGLSGNVVTASIPDIGSLRLPDSVTSEKIVLALVNAIIQHIRSVPKRCSINRLISEHNEVAIKFYSLFKILSASRPLNQETVTRNRIDIDSGIAIVTDKRTAPYHERRPVLLCPTLAAWLNTYLGWLRLVAYRISALDRQTASRIFSAADSSIDGDLHPLFFRFKTPAKTVPLGSADINDLHRSFETKSNSGRHLLDAVMRDNAIDSASIMGKMGRGNPGQETYGRWSAAVPYTSLSICSTAVEIWLKSLPLPEAPVLKPRQIAKESLSRARHIYIPKLLESDVHHKGSVEDCRIGSAEPCPFVDDVANLASNFRDYFIKWRTQTPDEGWFGVAQSLIIEDGVIHEDELIGALRELDAGKIYITSDKYFVDSCTKNLGIRRTYISAVTVRLVNRVPPHEHSPPALDALKSVTRGTAAAHPAQHVRFLLKASSAYCSLHMSGVVFGWSSGAVFARTSRPESIARLATGCIEPPKFDLRSRKRNIAAAELATDVLKEAKEIFDSTESHTRTLSVLQSRLQAMESAHDGSIHASLVAGYLNYLAHELRNFQTLVRYESAARIFLEKAAKQIEELGRDHVDWMSVVRDSLSNVEPSGSAPDHAAINHALEWIGIDLHVLNRKSAPPSAFQYSELPAQREVESALLLLKERSKKPGDDWHLAWIALSILSLHPHRWDAVAHLRLCDLCLDTPKPFLVITYEAGASLKSHNAPRVLELSDPSLLSELWTLRDLRLARFPNDNLVPLFGDHEHHRSVVTAERIHELISESLWRVTGSAVIQVHDIRHRVITDRIGFLLRLATSDEYETLRLRQGIYACSFEAGQSCPQVAVENYMHDLETYRSDQYAAIKKKIDLSFSDSFYSTVTEVRGATVRKRRSRHMDYQQNLLEGFDWSHFRSGATVLPLSELVAPGENQIAWSVDDQQKSSFSYMAIYFGLRVLGESKDAARAASTLSAEEAQMAEGRLEKFNRLRVTPWRARADINRPKFIDAVLGNGLAVAMAAARPAAETLLRIACAVDTVGDEWAFATPQDALYFSAWAAIWAANEVSTEILFRSSGRSIIDDRLIAEAKERSFTKARTLPARHFHRGSSAVLRFYESHDKSSKKRGRASPQITFLVTACALSVIANNQGSFK